MIKLFHVIVGLNTGGAEMMLYKLLSHMDRNTFIPHVVSLTDIGPVGETINTLDIPLTALGMKRGIPDPTKVAKLVGLFKKEKPDIIQTWMYHADLIGGLAAKLNKNIPVIWGIRHSNLTPEGNKKSTIFTAKLCAKLSKRIPERIICNSEASKQIHNDLGYDSNKMLVIPNGFDLSAFSPDLNAKHSVRRELNIPDDAIIIVCVARFTPLKDHYNFIQAASLLIDKYSKKAIFLLCGDGVNWNNQQLVQWIEEANVRRGTFLLGKRNDISRITAAVDIASSSSFGESFPNVIGEAMACEVPCVVTDVGDSALIVGDTGLVVPPKNPEALAQAWLQLINMSPEERTKLGIAARKRVIDKYNLPGIVSRFEKIYKKTVNCHKNNKDN